MGESFQSPVIYQNVNRVRDLVSDPHFKGERIGVLIHCESGEFTIPQSIENLSFTIEQKEKRTQDASSVKYAELKILRNRSGKISFEWEDKKWQKALSKKALLVVQKTQDALNHCGQISSSGDVKEVLLHCVRSLKEEMQDEAEVHEGWSAHLTRIGAEKILKKLPVGSYILRRGDDYTHLIEGNLAEKDSFPVRCYVITVIEAHSKISDKILIQRPGGWAIYNDDLLLSDYSFCPLEEVIHAAGGVKPYDRKKAA